MKTIVFLVIHVILLVSLAQAYPASEEGELEKLLEEENQANKLINRQKRFTCDVLSFIGPLTHFACGMRCGLTQQGDGYCNDKAICICSDPK